MYDEKTEVDVTLDCSATSDLSGKVLARVTYVPDVGAYEDWRVVTNEGRDGSWKIPYDVSIEYELVLPSCVETSMSEMGTRELGTVDLSRMLDPLDVDALDSDDSDARGLLNS